MTDSSKDVKKVELPAAGTFDLELQAALAADDPNTDWNDDLPKAPPWPTKDGETLVIFIQKKGSSRPVEKPDDGQIPNAKRKTSKKKPSLRKKVN